MKNRDSSHEVILGIAFALKVYLFELVIYSFHKGSKECILRVELKLNIVNETKATRIGNNMLSGLSTELATALIVIHGDGHNAKVKHSPKTFMAGEPTSRREFGYGKNEQSIPLTPEEKESKLFQITPEQKDAMLQKYNSAEPKSNPNIEDKK